MRLCIFLLLHILGGGLTPVLAQNYFEGELDYRNTFIDKQSFERLFEDVSEMISIKGGKYKLNFIQPRPGQLNWQIDNFENGQGYEYKDSTYIKVVARVDSTMTMDSTSIPAANDSSFICRVYEKQLCRDSSKKLPSPNQKLYSGLRILDTVMVIAGLNCNIMEDIKDGFRVAEYYYCDSIKLDPLHYSCLRMDGDDRLYKFNNGSLITKRVIYDIDDYIWVLELRSVREKKIRDEDFEVPTDFEVVRLNK